MPHRKKCIAGHGRPQDGRIIMFIKERKFQRVIEKIFVIFYIQIFVVNIIRRNAVQLLQQRALGLCDMKFPARRFPSSHFDRIHMEILSPVKHDDNGCLGKSVCL